MKTRYFRVLTAMIIVFSSCGGSVDLSGDAYGATPTDPSSQSTVWESVIVDTGQDLCYDTDSVMGCPDNNDIYGGQDAVYSGSQPSYTDNGDGTITDNVTGLMWQKDPGEKITYAEAVSEADDFSLAGHNDWRLPTIKELYSLIMFSGKDPSGYDGTETTGMIPFINIDYFTFAYGDTDAGVRLIDSQWATSTVYGSTVMEGDECFFGVNFADGRIKCYPISSALSPNNSGYFVIYVRGCSYGTNNFVDNGDGTISDAQTGLMWMRVDSGDSALKDNLSDATFADGSLNWPEALQFCEALDYAGHNDWRLPNAKELQGIIDYTRSPTTTGSAAIDPVFEVTSITDESGHTNYPYHWTSTTHVHYLLGGENAVYISFGEALGFVNGSWIDVHGAGAQRSDPKVGDPADYPIGHGPQGDAIRIFNYARCVRGE